MYIKSTYDGLHVITGTTEHVSGIEEAGKTLTDCSFHDPCSFLPFGLPKWNQMVTSKTPPPVSVRVTYTSSTKAKTCYALRQPVNMTKRLSRRTSYLPPRRRGRPLTNTTASNTSGTPFAG